jgi:hypothetical protein
MPHHEERPPNTLAHGPAKPDDIDRVRRDVSRVEERESPEVRVLEAERSLVEMEAACETIRRDVTALKRAVAR